jgi:hypothetical protein
MKRKSVFAPYVSKVFDEKKDEKKKARSVIWSLFRF